MTANGDTYSGGEAALSSEQVVDLTSALALLAQLRLLDATWTEQARAASKERGPARAARISALGGVVDALDDGLARLADLAERLEPVFADHADAMRREFAKAIEPAGGRGLTDTQRTRLRDVVGGGDFAEAVRDAASRLRQTAKNETATIRAEYGQLSLAASRKATSAPRWKPTWHSWPPALPSFSVRKRASSWKAPPT